MSAPEIRRTAEEAFRETHGYAPNYAPLNTNRLRYSDDGLYRVVLARIAELEEQGVPAFAERLRIAENEAEDWLDDVGWPTPDEPDSDDDDAWERWMDRADMGYDPMEEWR